MTYVIQIGLTSRNFQNLFSATGWEADIHHMTFERMITVRILTVPYISRLLGTFEVVL